MMSRMRSGMAQLPVGAGDEDADLVLEVILRRIGHDDQLVRWMLVAQVVSWWWWYLNLVIRGLR